MMKNNNDVEKVAAKEREIAEAAEKERKGCSGEDTK
jgi:hypothetical protein